MNWNLSPVISPVKSRPPHPPPSSLHPIPATCRIKKMSSTQQEIQSRWPPANAGHPPRQPLLPRRLFNIRCCEVCGASRVRCRRAPFGSQYVQRVANFIYRSIMSRPVLDSSCSSCSRTLAAKLQSRPVRSVLIMLIAVGRQFADARCVCGLCVLRLCLMSFCRRTDRGRRCRGVSRITNKKRQLV